MRTHKNVRIWLAVAIMATITLARGQAGLGASASSHSVLAFLSSHALRAELAAQSGALARAQNSDRPAHNWSSGSGTGAWVAMLPVFFIGLLVPFSLLAPRTALCLGHRRLAPALPFLFQRPPPSVRF